LAIRSVTVTDWNGKSLSCSFGSSVEVEPEVDEAKTLRDYYDSTGANDPTRISLSTDRFKSASIGDNAGFVTLRHIHDEFKEASSSAPARY
jgi:hypothetical protein